MPEVHAAVQNDEDRVSGCGMISGCGAIFKLLVTGMSMLKQLQRRQN